MNNKTSTKPYIKHLFSILKGKRCICGLLVVINDTLWGTIHPKGMFKLFGKELLWEEFLIHGIDVLLMLIIVYF